MSSCKQEVVRSISVEGHFIYLPNRECTCLRAEALSLGVLLFRLSLCHEASVSMNFDSEQTLKRGLYDEASKTCHVRRSLARTDKMAALQESFVSESKHLPPEVPNGETSSIRKSGQPTQPVNPGEQVL